MSDVPSLNQIRQACSGCSLRQLCLPYGVAENDLDQLEQIVSRRKPVAAGHALFHQGEKLGALYAVRSGSVKTHALSRDGNEQITGFHFPGELVGLDALSADVHGCTATTLETTTVCAIPFDRLDELAGRIPGLRRQLLRLMSRELVADEQMLLLVGQKTAEQRLAALLLSISSRFHSRGYSATEFNLSMSRDDIGNYLGLAVETVSRLFSRFQSDKLLRVRRKNVRLLDVDRLHAIAGIGPLGPSRARA
ncbi:MAG TPA: fumarate/nitrate reduction transcriptional regulator Fnr [Gammaproteobacteria bacterium]|nr:fumarate/nitrate reduction transcriptional regulator Fnr [Gammaproteobacteria bacterium]